MKKKLKGVLSSGDDWELSVKAAKIPTRNAIHLVSRNTGRTEYYFEAASTIAECEPTIAGSKSGLINLAGIQWRAWLKVPICLIKETSTYIPHRALLYNIIRAGLTYSYMILHYLR